MELERDHSSSVKNINARGEGTYVCAWFGFIWNMYTVHMHNMENFFRKYYGNHKTKLSEIYFKTPTDFYWKV